MTEPTIHVTRLRRWPPRTRWSVLLGNGRVLAGEGRYREDKARQRAVECAEDFQRTARYAADGMLTNFTLRELLAGESVEFEVVVPQ